MTAPVVHSLREQIREHIVEGIVSGRWKPGERIVERRIATELEVSQTPYGRRCASWSRCG